MSNTDVAHSIAGYYFQLLLACNEIVKLINDTTSTDDDWVAVEKGSDVKVHRNMNNEISIESKFYKIENNFTKEHPTIRHTIYNFYNDFMERKSNAELLCRYLYITNVCVSEKFGSKTFFEDWNNNKILNIDIYINYIKDCLIYESIDAPGVYRENFINYKKKIKLSGREVPPNDYFSEWYDYLVKDIRLGNEIYQNYANINDSYIREFVELIKFDFGKKKVYRLEMINEISNSIDADLAAFYGGLHKEFYHNIRNYIIERLFLTTIGRGEVSSIEDKIKKSHIIGLIEKPQKVTLDIINSSQMRLLIERLHEEIYDLQIVLRKHDTEIANKLFSLFSEVSEQFTKSLKTSETSLEIFLSKYSIDTSCSYSIIPNLSRVMSLLSMYEDIDTNSINLDNMDGINNFDFCGKYAFSLKATDSNSISKAEYLIIKFINKEMNSLRYPEGNETVVLYAPSLNDEYTPCKYRKDQIDEIIQSTVTEYTQTYNVEKDQDVYKSMEFRCTKCIDINNMTDLNNNKRNNFIIKGCKEV